jgi:DNA-binding CsgD family transcriptional regulator
MNTDFFIEQSVSVLDQKLRNREYTDDNYLGFYHENRQEDAQLVFLEEKGCATYGKTLSEIQAAGLAFLQEIMHPDDIERCVILLQQFAQKKNEKEYLSYFQRLRLLKSKEYKLYLTCVRLDNEQNLFKCITCPITEMVDFSQEVNRILDINPYIEQNQRTFDLLSEREKEVIHWVCKGLNVTQIGEKLFLSPHTIEKHKKNIYKKANFNSNAELIQFALNFNIV